jgi:hypothetical protein
MRLFSGVGLPVSEGLAGGAKEGRRERWRKLSSPHRGVTPTRHIHKSGNLERVFSRKSESPHIFLCLSQDDLSASLLHSLNSVNGAHGAGVSGHEGKELYGDLTFYSLVSRHYYG